MAGGAPNLAVLLVGDVVREPGARTKYGVFLSALGERFPALRVLDLTLHGVERWLNALRVAHPDRRTWRERFHKNVPAFCARSRRAARVLRSQDGWAGAALQLGVLFDAAWAGGRLPGVIYTDYTARLSAERPEAGRSPFTDAEREPWIALERQAFEHAAHVCTRSRLVRDSVVEDYGVPAERVTVVGGGVNFRPLPSVAARDDSRPPTALFIGKDFHRKGGDVLLRAFARARTKVPEARLLLLTSDPIPGGLPMDGVERIPPTWDREVIAGLYRRADLFVLPSRLETWGDVLLEAMAFGLPCIGTAGQAMQEVVRDGETGRLVAGGEVEPLADGLSLLLSDTALRRRWGAAGHRRVEAEFTWERVVERLAPVVEAAAEQKGLTP